LNLLLDTHVLLWAAAGSKRLSRSARALLLDEGNNLHFSPASLWEIVIKRRLGRDDLEADPFRLRRMLASSGYAELSVTSDHVLAVDGLPPLHNDPFDRLLIAQARSEGMRLLTVDARVVAYGDGILRI